MIIPDFQLQFEEILSKLDAQFEITRSVWTDIVQERCFRDYLDKYDEVFRLYLFEEPATKIRGKGLGNLLEFLNNRSNEIAQLSQIPFEIRPTQNSGRIRVSFAGDGGGSRDGCHEVYNTIDGEPVHDGYLNRNKAYETSKQYRDSEMDYDDIANINNQRE